MPLHLLKLCVGADSVEDLAAWVDERLAARRADGRPAEQIHTTRMTPRRREEILDGGSLYWVIKGRIAVRQRLLDIRPANSADGIPRCDLVLEPVLVRTEPRPHRPFQGWRYLEPTSAPPDLSIGGGDDGASEIKAALAELGLL